MDTFTKEKRSEIMSRVKGKDSKLELQLRRELTKANLRYRKHVTRLPGKPDVAFIGRRIAIFVDSCFWHCCPEHGTIPATNRKFWRDKLRGNYERDHAVNLEYEQMGWMVVRIWEHDFKKDGEKVTRELIKTIRSVELRARPAHGRSHV